jgi:hypothetical protein
VFGKGVIQTYAQDFSKGNNFDPSKQIGAALNALIQEAVAVIQEHQPKVSLTIGVTYFPLYESDLPWEDEEVWSEPKELPDVNVRPASFRWLVAPCIEEEPGTEHERVNEDDVFQYRGE